MNDDLKGWKLSEDVSPFDVRLGMRLDEDGIYHDDLYDTASRKAYKIVKGKVYERPESSMEKVACKVADKLL